ncbi:MAG: hypothetical protein Tsb0014_46260 [Pleurocapsa sp.]
MKSVYWSIDKLPGLQPQDRQLLKENGITNTQQLLNRGGNLAAKENLAQELQLSLQYIMKWIALADLARVPSIGCQYCGLVLHSGIVSVAQLAQTPFPRLHRQIVRLQVATLGKKGDIPSLAQVKQWVQEAKLISRQ